MLDNVFKIFFDTEFTGLHQHTTLISIGCVTEKNNCFYFENTEFDRNQADNWIRQNVISNLKFLNTQNNETRNLVVSKPKIVTGFGTLDFLKKQFTKWIKEQYDKYKSDILFISDVSHYDAVLLFELFNGAIHLPEYIVPFVWDINQDLCRYLNITPQEAFDLNRERFVEEKLGIELDNKSKHNSLHDAFVIKTIFKVIYS